MKQGWKIRKLGEVCDAIGGGTPSKANSKFYNGDIFWATVRDMKGDLIKVTEHKITRDAVKNSSTNIIPKGNVIIATRVGLGKVCLIENDTAINQDLRGIVPKRNSDILVGYLFQWFKSISNLIIEEGTGATVQGVKLPFIKDLQIPLPSLTEQKQIVAILDEAFVAIDKAKANAEQNLKNAKELFDVYLHKYYTSKEEGWEEKKLKEVAEYFNGLTYSPKDVSNEGIIVLRSSNVQNDELDFDDIVRVNLKVKEKIIVKDGDILMCSRNGSARLVGKTATIKNLNEEMTFGTFMMIIRSQYNPYLSWFFKSTDFRNQIKGGENTMINQITRYMLDDIVISFPPIDKQKEVVQKLDALSLEIKKLEVIYNQKLVDLEELKKSVLQKAFRGELKTSKVLAK